MENVKKINAYDFIGIFLSVLCAIHCTLTPLILLFLPKIASFFQNEYFHITMFLLIVPIACFSFLRCYKLHKDKTTLRLGLSALFLLFLGLTADYYSETLEQVFTVAGSILIVIAHIKNIRFCRCLKNPGKGHCSH